MLYPTIDELTKGKYNRYELALATARCARLVTDEYVRQHDAAEKSLTGNKETDKPLNTMIDRELRDEKAVKVAIGRMHRGEYEIDPEANEKMIAAAKLQQQAVVEKPISLKELFADKDDDEDDEPVEEDFAEEEAEADSDADESTDAE